MRQAAPEPVRGAGVRSDSTRSSRIRGIRDTEENRLMDSKFKMKLNRKCLENIYCDIFLVNVDIFVALLKIFYYSGKLAEEL